MQYRTPTAQFTTLIVNNLRFWQETAVRPEARPRLQSEQQNVYQAIDMGLQVAATMPTATDLLLDLSLFIEQHGSWRVWIPLLEKSVAAHEDVPKRWQLQTLLAFFYHANGEGKTAVSILRPLLNKPLDIAQRGRVHYHLGNSYSKLRQYDDARIHVDKALAIFEAHPEASRGGSAPALNLLGRINLRTGKQAAAIPLFMQARQRWEQDGYYTYALLALYNEAQAHSEYGQPEEALRCYQQAISLLETAGTLLDAASVYLNLGSFYAAQGKWAEAEAAYLRADRASLHQQGHLELYAKLITSLGFVLMEQGRLETAVFHTTEAITIWQQLGDEPMEANALENLGDAHFRMGDLAAAQASYQRGVDLTSNYPDNLFARQLRQTLEKKVRGLGKSQILPLA